MNNDLISIMDMLDRPIAYQRAFVRLGAGVTGAVLLSQAVYWSRRTKHAGGWFYKSQAEWEEETGLTRREQERARKFLIAAGVLEECRKGIPARLYFRDIDQKLAQLLSGSMPTNSAEELVSAFQATLKNMSRTGYMRAVKAGVEAEYVDYGEVIQQHGLICSCCKGGISYGPGRSSESLSFDYIVEIGNGGPHTDKNIRPAHLGCVMLKGNSVLAPDLFGLDEADKFALSKQTGVLEQSRQEFLGEADITENTTEITAESTTDIFSDTEKSVSAAEFLPNVLSEQKQPPKKRNTPSNSNTDPIWNAYKNAHFARYKTEPVRNQKVNSQIKQLYQRLGEEAAAVTEFYVLNVNDAFVVRKTHDIGLLLASAESYRTQWAIGSAMTQTRARQIDSTQANASAADEAIAMLRARNGGESC